MQLRKFHILKTQEPYRSWEVPWALVFIWTLWWTNCWFVKDFVSPLLLIFANLLLMFGAVTMVYYRSFRTVQLIVWLMASIQCLVVYT